MIAKKRKLALEPCYKIPEDILKQQDIPLDPSQALYLLKQLNGINPKTRTSFQASFDIPVCKVKHTAIESQFRIWRTSYKPPKEKLTHIWDLAYHVLIHRHRCDHVKVTMRSHNRTKPSANRLLRRETLLTHQHMLIVAGAVCTMDHTLLMPLLCPPNTQWLIFDGQQETWSTGKELARKWDHNTTTIPLVRAVKFNKKTISLNNGKTCYRPTHPLFTGFTEEAEECLKFGEFGRYERLPCMDGLI